ncbi:platelet glycoprotein 4-like [Ptychodera flava]|uniref:platelet glycoprotein 4-like n=1 Tax=Ptychodera flava TaxID=63121 RepID=UPI00396A9848
MVHAAIKFGIPLVLGTVLVGLGIGLYWILDNVIHKIVKQQMTLSEDSKTYDTWRAPDIPVYMQFFVFDLVNPAEVMSGQKLPWVVQRGPYTYRETRVKENITWNEDGTVSYRQPVTYVFDREMSVGWDSDTVTTINLPLLTVANLVKYEPDWLQYLVEALEKVSDASLFMEIPVKGLMWGYEDPMLEFIQDALKDFGVHIPTEFGIFMGRNGSDDGEYTVYTDAERLNIIKDWQNASSLSWWPDKYANMINGTDGSLAPPFFDPSQPAYIYSSDICRSVYGLYEKDVDIKGISVKRYTSPKKLLADNITNPDNAGFCTPNHDYCLPGGLLNASNCQKGAPVVYSLPHFLYADEHVQLPCLNPNKEEHQTLIDTDYITGVSMRVAKRLQINAHLQRHQDIDDLSKVNDQFYPVVWINETYTIDDASVAKYKSQVALPVKLCKYIPWVVVGIGCLIILITVLALVLRKQKEQSSGGKSGYGSIQNSEDREPLLGGSGNRRV